METVLEKGVVYHFDYQKNVSWDADAPEASFWENFAYEKDLLLPAGEYTVILDGAFTLDRTGKNHSELLCELNILVE